MNENLTFKAILSNGISLGLKNLVPIILAVLLWVVTIWIPVINVGTTIALMTLPAEISRGTTISPLYIFDSKYRKYMGEFFLVTALVNTIIAIGFCFMIIPGIMVAYAYSFASLLVVDKGVNPVEALSKSNKMTYGYKMQMFLSYFIVGVIAIVVLLIACKIHALLGVLVLIAFAPITLSITGYIYGELSKNMSLDETNIFLVNINEAKE